MTPGFERFLKHSFASHLLSGHMAIEVVGCQGGGARLRLPFRSHYLQNMGVVQGGILATLADMTMAWAVMSQTYPYLATTIDINIRYLRPTSGQDLDCEAVVLRSGRSVAFASADVMAADGIVVANATASFLIRSPAEAGVAQS